MSEEEYDYRIERDGMVIETNNMRFAAEVVWPDEPLVGGEPENHTDLEPDHIPMQVREQRGRPIEVDRLMELCQAWQRKSMNSDLPSAKRAAYCDAEEKLSAVIQGSEWTESP